MYEDILHAAGFHGYGAQFGGEHIDASHDVLSGANSGRGIVDIDRRIPQYSPHLRDASGRPVNIWNDLAEHEEDEEKEMKRGLPYKKAHPLATQAEKTRANALGIPWRPLEDEIAGLLSHIEHEKVHNPPKNALHVSPRAAIR